MGLEAGLGEALRTDYFMLREEFTPAQLDYLERTRGFVHEEVLPVINGYWERARPGHHRRVRIHRRSVITMTNLSLTCARPRRCTRTAQPSGSTPPS